MNFFQELCTKKYMDKQVIFYIALVSAILFGLFWLVIIVSISRQRGIIRQARSCFTDQQNTIIVKCIYPLEEPVHYYQKEYTHQLIGVDVITKQEVILYVTKIDASDFLEKDEYQITHDGVVMLEYKKNYF